MIEEKKELKKRRVLQMARFYGAAAFTLITMRLISRAIKVRKCMYFVLVQWPKLIIGYSY